MHFLGFLEGSSKKQDILNLFIQNKKADIDVMGQLFLE